MLLLSVVATSVVLAYAEAVNPKDFACTSATPTGGDVFSDGEPQVNLVHIFCGQVTKKKASGFHCHPGGDDPDCAQASDGVKIQSNDLEFTTYNTIQVYDKIQKKWVKKGPRPTSFWPTSLSIPEVVNTIEELYASCTPDKKEKRICIEDFSIKVDSEKFDVIIDMKGCKVKTSYPMPRGTCSNEGSAKVCKHVCAKNEEGGWCAVL